MKDRLLVGRRVLVVEDEMMVLMLLEGMLEDLGCQAISSAATVGEAINLIRSTPFDAATLDLNLNGANSLPVADMLSARGVPFAFATAYSDPRLLNGFNDRPMLKKPFSAEEMARVFETLLAPDQPKATA